VRIVGADVGALDAYEAHDRIVAARFDEHVDRIAKEFSSIINEPAFKERHLTNRSLVVGTNVGEQFAEELRKDHADAAQVVKDSGLTPQ
jgi:tripartite-type tricarboxylate transporter receptor subunit TctC